MGLFLVGKFFVCCGALGLGLGLSCLGLEPTLPSDLGLPFPMNVTNGSGLGFGFDSAICDGFDLGSLSMAYPSVKQLFQLQSISAVKT